MLPALVPPPCPCGVAFYLPWQKSPYFFGTISVLFHDGKPVFFGHTAGDGWNQTGDNRTDEEYGS